MLKAQFATDQGKIREKNEDAGGIFYNQAKQLLAIVADGMGGHQAGEVASDYAVSMAKTTWEQTEEISSQEEAETWLNELITEMNTYIYGQSLMHEEQAGMGTTVVLTLCTDTFFTVAHVGDSRCYYLEEAVFSQITHDHSYVNELIRSGEITENDAEHHPRKNVLLRVVGTEETVQADIQSFVWQPGEQLLLCSDGLTNKLSDDEIETRLRASNSSDVLLTELIHVANERGGEDNISIVTIKNILREEVGDDTC